VDTLQNHPVNYLSILNSAWTSLVPVICIIIGYFLSTYQKTSDRKIEYIYHQINDFYNPIVSCISKIENISSVTRELSLTASEGWKKLHERSPQPFYNHDEAFKPFEALIEYDKNQFLKEIMPLYKDILDIFTKNYYLADDKSKEFYGEYLKFIEIWNRHLTSPLPDDVYEIIIKNWPNTDLFFNHIKKQLNSLTKKIS